VVISCERSEQVKPDIGLQFYSLRKQFENDVPGTLKMISDWGIAKIEGGDTYGVPLEEFKALLLENNLQVVSVGADYNDLKTQPEKVIRNAKSFGASYAMCPWIPHQEDEFTFDDAKMAVDLFNSAGKLLADEGIELVYHPHGYEFRPYGQGNLFDYMLENSENFDFEMDVYWFTHGGADPLAYLNAHPDQFKLLHLKDMQIGVLGNDTGHEDVETNVELGTGQIDIVQLVIRARELGIEYMFIEDESSSVVDQVPESLEFLANIP
ncbi:MAG: sugar phosphate isomerase/epimerase family protein, partial [Flavobacteriaceae bacterium]